MKVSQDLHVSNISDDGQSGQLPEQARRGAVNRADQEEQKDGAIQAHHQLQSDAVSRIERPLQQVQENQQHIENDEDGGVKKN
ncbi:hypothetical protein C2S52_012289 [Perilla frutescens var. hirtella]|nr:hypothetical protein C2S52_012289 [Perilla frutescens var. hirtella]KAH6785141.1 hypothetical protein C2S51_037596 [Perilla frutescens var. frutescens]